VVPVAATVATARAFAAFDKDPYLHTSTFSGAPLAMAAARGAIQAIRDDDLVDRARVLGAELLTEIRRILREHFGTALREVRGVGLLLGIEFAEPGPAGDLLIELATQGVVANHSLNSHLTMRLTPPAILGRADVDYLLSAMDRASRMTASRYADMKR